MSSARCVEQSFIDRSITDAFSLFSDTESFFEMAFAVANIPARCTLISCSPLMSKASVAETVTTPSGVSNGFPSEPVTFLENSSSPSFILSSVTAPLPLTVMRNEAPCFSSSPPIVTFTGRLEPYATSSWNLPGRE